MLLVHSVTCNKSANNANRTTKLSTCMRDGTGKSELMVHLRVFLTCCMGKDEMVHVAKANPYG